MRLSDLIRSSHVRFAALITAAVFACYLAAGWAAYRTVGQDLNQRVQDRARLASLELQDIYLRDGRQALATAVDERAQVYEPDDVILWLGDAAGNRLAGQTLAAPTTMTTGDHEGRSISLDGDDAYHVLVSPFEDMVLITGASYEESDEISHRIFAAFGLATGGAFLLATLCALLLAARGLRRIEAIDHTLKRVAAGDLDSRIRTSNQSDDLSRLSSRINSALDQLSATVEGIRQVSVDIAHDLRTPVNRLGIRLEELKASLSGSPELESRVDAVFEDSRQVVQTFDAILRISQIEAGARRARFRSVSLGDVSQRLRDAYEAVVEDNGQTISFTTESTDGGQIVFGDIDLLTQLFANLIENAVRHAGQGAHIELAIRSDAAGVTMSVADNGPGVPADERSRILDRFYRLDKSRQTAGSGLGLSLVRAIAGLHDGDIALSDAGPGLMVGVRFPHFYDALKSREGIR